MRVRGRARQRGVELPLVVSDHCDWPELLTTIEETGAQEIWVTHGREDALVHQIGKMENVTLYPESRMMAADVVETDADQVVLATGARWRTDGIGRSRRRPIGWGDDVTVRTPDDVMSGVTITGPSEKQPR